MEELNKYQDRVTERDMNELIADFRDAVSHSDLSDADKQFLTSSADIPAANVSIQSVKALGVINAVIDAILVRIAQLSTRSDMERFVEALQPAFPSVSGSRWTQLINRCKREN
jgi:hypothetical protein